jgi:DNA-binding transcriptional ArsR family regulator
MSTKQTTATEEGEQRTPNHQTPLALTEDASLDATFELLKNRRRRLVLRHLETASQPVSIGDLAEHVAAAENGIRRNELSSQQRKRVYISLYQSHLPKMDEADAIQFDQDRGTISLTDTADAFYEFLDGAPDRTASHWLPMSRDWRLAVALVTGIIYAVAVFTGSTMIGSGVVFLFLCWFVVRNPID